MKTKYLIIALLGVFLLGLTVTKSSGQDIRYSQTYANPLKLNPAIMGGNSDLRVILNYKNQWANIQKGFQSYSINALYPLFLGDGKNKLDFGVGAEQTKAGAFTTMDAFMSINFNKQIGNYHNISLALFGGYVMKSLDIASLTFDEQYVLGSYNAGNTNSETILNNKINYPDAGFGLMWFYNPDSENGKINAFTGVSGYHMNKPNYSLIAGAGRVPQRYSIQSGIKIMGDNKIDVSPQIRFSTQAGAEEMAVGIYLDYNFSETAKLVLGTWYKRMDALAFHVGFEHKNFTFGYVYDMTNSDIAKAISGINTHGIALSFKLNQAEKKEIKGFNTPFNSF